MKRAQQGFTLIELLVVTVVIAILAGIVFRLAGMGDDTNKTSTTVQRIQKVEFALSAYYAAFGSYPPVKLHGVRDVYRKVYDNDVQSADENEQESELLWENVRAACRSQPLSAEFPYCYDRYRDYFSEVGGGYAPLNTEWSGNLKATEDSWLSVRIFKFGVMSYLLPRYFFMLDGRDEYYDECAQWENNNRIGAFYEFSTGLPMFTGEKPWQQLLKKMHTGEHWTENARPDADVARVVSNMTSQAVCARWLPALEGLVVGASKYPLFGVSLRDGSSEGKNENTRVYTSGERGAGSKYVLNCYTVVDGWGYELYYYSPAPYQSYRLWSAGPDHKTFPPWIDLKEMQKDSDRTKAAGWMADDIVNLQN